MSKKEFFILLFITFIVIMIWVIADIIHSKASVQIDPKLQGLLEPIEPDFDEQTLFKVNQNFSNLNNVPNFLPTPTQNPLTQESSASNEPISTDSAEEFDTLDNDISNL